MKRVIILIVLVLSSYQLLMGDITRTLTMDCTSFSDVYKSINGRGIPPDQSTNTPNTFLSQSKDVIVGGYNYKGEDIDRSSYEVANYIADLANYLLPAIISTNHLTEFMDIDDTLYELTNGSDAFTENGLFNYFTSYNADENAKTRALYLCYLTVKASAVFDALYYYYYEISSPGYDLQKLNTLRRIVKSCYDLLEFIDYAYCDPVHGLQTENNHYAWGSPNDPYYLDGNGNQVFTPDEVFDPVTNNNIYVYLPKYYLIQDRLMMNTAWGYAALVLRKDAEITQPSGYLTYIAEMNTCINNIKNMLTSDAYPNVGTCQNKTGLLAFHTNDSGGYIESLGYLNWVMMFSCPFFSNLARLSPTDSAYYNYYDNPYIIGWINDITEKTTPYLGDWAYNDTYYVGYGSVRNPNYIGDQGNLNCFMGCVAACYYYNSSNSNNIKSKCSWYINSRRLDIVGYPGLFEWGEFYIYELLYLSNPNEQMPEVTAPIPPTSYSQGSWTNSEFGILRKPITNTDDLVNNPSMYITFKHSMNHWHNHADQTSYSFFYKGKQFLLDPGYRNNFINNSNYTHTWMESPYAHNMIVVSPLDDTERDELQHGYIEFDDDTYIDGSYLKCNGSVINHSFRPTCRQENTNPDSDNYLYKSPAYKKYFTINNNSDLLQTCLRYDYSAPLGGFTVDLTRSYIRDGELFFIFDDLVSSNNSFISYWNLLQMGFTENSIGLPETGSHYSCFSLTKGSENDPSYPNNLDCVDFALGNNMSASSFNDNPIPINIDQETSTSYSNYPLPSCNTILERIGGDTSQGIRVGNRHKCINHKRVRSSAWGVSPKFLTVIAPRETYNSPLRLGSDIYNYGIYYGTCIISKSHTNQSACKTYACCSNGTDISAVYQNSVSTNTINTNSKFFVVTKPDDSNLPQTCLDNSLILIEGNYLIYNSNEVYRIYTQGVDITNASYLNGCLHVELHASSECLPKFKISRSGNLPQNFSASMQYSNPVIPPAEPEIGTTIEDIVQMLAYDEDYFYVNYSIDDLMAECLLNSDTYIFKGEYVSPMNWSLLQFQGQEITLSGDWAIPPESRINITGNSSITLSPDFNIAVDGVLSITGMDNGSRCSLFSPDENNWGQIVVNSCGRLEMQYANIEKATVIQSRGKLDIRNVTINNCQAGIMLISRADGWIEDTVISNCDGYGLVLQNCLPDAYRSRFSKLHFNNNKYGIFLYNSSPIIDSIMVVNNDEVGVLCMRNSNPYITRSAFSDTYIHLDDTERPEFTLYQSCYPILDKNDIIFGDGYSLFSYDPNPFPYACPNNYWGTIDESIIAQSFYPPEWPVDFIPFLTDSFHSAGNQNLIASYFEQALGFEENNELATARLMYKTIIVTYPTAEVAMAAASRLVCIAVTEEELILAKNYLEGIYDQYPSIKLAETARLDYLVCQRLLEEYSEAIAGYQELLENCSTYIDSLLTQLDIIYTFLEAESNGNKALTETVMCIGELLISSKRAKELESQILGILLNQPYPGEVTYHVPDYIVVTDNYPNPFNPTTTIRFSIPKSSDCELIIYNVKGQAVKHLMSETKERGIYRLIWDSKDDNGSLVGSGVYFYRIRIDGLATTKKMLLLK